MIFVDASALVAILAHEAGYSALFARIKDDPKRRFSGVSRWEAVAGLCRSHGYRPTEAMAFVDDFLETFRFEIVPIGPREASLATEAYDRYGRGRHPASLNMGDCFAYACAKSIEAKLLYKGDDFAETDLA